MGVVIEFRGVRRRGLALELAKFLNVPMRDSNEAVDYAYMVLEQLRDRGRTPETEYLALQYADLFMILLEESEPEPDPDSPEDTSQGGCRQFG